MIEQDICRVRLITCRKKHTHSDACAWAPCVRRGGHSTHVTEIASEENGLLPRGRCPITGTRTHVTVTNGEATHCIHCMREI